MDTGMRRTQGYVCDARQHTVLAYGQAERFVHSSLACLSYSRCFLGLRAQPNRNKVSTAYQSQ